MNLIFDIDGTLWDTTEIVAYAWNDAVCNIGLEAQFGRFITADMLKKEFGKPMDVIVEDLLPTMPLEIRDSFMYMCQKLEQSRLSDEKKDLTYPNVSKTIESLSKSHKIYIVSNCQEGYIPLATDKIYITKFITDSECFGVTGLSKADNIKLLMNRNNLSLNDTYYIGDTYGDYLATSEANITFIHAAYGFGSMNSDYNGLSINSIEELITLFD